jgi:hypothetical protein
MKKTDKPDNAAKDQSVKLKKQLADCGARLAEVTTDLEKARSERDQLRSYHEGPDLSANPIRLAEDRALKSLQSDWSKFARALAVYVREDSYAKLGNALPAIAYGYSGDTPPTAYNRFLRLLYDELQELNKSVSHRHAKAG